MILRLIAADLYEEKVLMVEGDLTKLKAFYQARYFANPEDEKLYRKLRRTYDPSVDERAQVDDETTALLGGGSNVRAQFTSVVGLAGAKMLQLDAIREQELELNAALLANSESLKRIDKRKKDF
jgi:hypothetical protein